MPLADQAIEIFNQALTHVDPSKVIPDALQWNASSGELTILDSVFHIRADQPVYIIGAGKASVQMALAVENELSGRIKDGIIISPNEYKGKSSFQVFKGSHPLPDKESLSSSYELVSFIKKLPDNAFVLNLISGGTSSLFCLPAGDLEIEDVQEIYSLLIESGADIHQINTVRKVFSSVKGGQILHHLKGRHVIDLLISDITDDDISMIGSGPSIAQPISATEAFQVLKQFKLYNSIPHTARQFLALEMDKEMKTKAIRNTQEIEQHQSFIIASASMMATHAADIAKSMGFDVTLNKKAVTEQVEDVTSSLITQIKELAKSDRSDRAIISYGEPTVRVTGDGLGGRNQELALRMAIALQDFDQPIAFLSAGSDGIDGPTDAAGAVVTERTYQESIESDLDPDRYLKENDSYHFFRQAGGHIKPGPTGNNLMDLQITLLET